MQLGLSALYAFLDNSSTPVLTLATVIRTEGASYRKAGAMMLIDANMNSSGLVSGGCLEDDLKIHAESVMAGGVPKIVEYDLGQEEAASMWGLGLGCGGHIEVLLERIDAGNQFGGLAQIRAAFMNGTRCWLHKVVASNQPASVGTYTLETSASHIRVGNDETATPLPNFDTATLSQVANDTILSIPVSPIRRLLVCGAGPDAIPLVQLAAHCGWQVVVADPRPAYLKPGFFPDAVQLLENPPDAIDLTSLGAIQAAVVMTHNVERDCAWLVKLCASPVSYIGLLGPSARRDMLLKRAGLPHDARLHGPAGLDIGATLPEEIALSIVAQMHAAIGQRSGQFLA